MGHSNLNRYRKNLHSQYGEDGIISEICKRLDLSTGWFVEFGAWDGKYLSNTFRLLSQADWCGVYIEGDSQRYQVLQRTCAAFPNRAYPLCAMVGFSGDGKLDDLLEKTPIPKNFDLLSVDIDSYDWQVWNALERYEPQIVIIESNACIPPGVVSIHNPPASQGASFTALVDLGKRKGYQLVCHTGNCIFVRKELASKLGLPPELLSEPEKMFNYRRHYKERMIAVARAILPNKLLNELFHISYLLKKYWRQ